ncbi:unnamed protein product [Phaedon cochleariae]|uniref:Large ribosomal subunit protein mL40 n=1 Tax=Phaedon cochleariae TaxID=80249 RepID=A0A9P0DRX3_PHACE|nr:unnamed protein product [Phaedon cochleariae]
MSLQNIISRLSRIALHGPNRVRNISTSTILQFRSTPVLLAEPLKKKKRLDPAVVRAREERKKKKIEKQIRRLEKSARTLKPIDECEVSIEIKDELGKRKRDLAALSCELLEKRVELEKQWCQYRREQHLTDIQMLDRITNAQQKALDELKKESEELYQEAIQFDFHLMPFNSKGPVETPAVEEYDAPDGDYQDISKKW